MNWEQIEAEVAPGQRLASGTATRDPMFNEEIIKDGVKGKGTIFLQASEFKEQGLDLDTYFGECGYFSGTLNLLIAPRTWKLGRNGFEHVLRNVRWTDKLDETGKPPFTETFMLSPCDLEFNDIRYKGMIYIPDPNTKPGKHAPLAPYIDIIAPSIPGIGYGSKVTFFYNPAAIQVARAELTSPHTPEPPTI
jgi:hypothetical protein